MQENEYLHKPNLSISIVYTYLKKMIFLIFTFLFIIPEYYVKAIQDDISATTIAI